MVRVRVLPSPSSGAPNAPEEASGYFATEPHYRSLANRITASLRPDRRFVLVTGDPPVASHLLSQALRKSAHSRYTVIDIACHADLTPEDLARANSAVASLPASGEALALPEGTGPPPPLFVFTDVDQLSDRQLEEIVEAVRHRGRDAGAAVLLAPSDFLTRLKEPSLQFLQEQCAARLGLQEVGEDEGIEFLRHQLASRQAGSEARGMSAGGFRVLAAAAGLLVIGIGCFLLLQQHHLISEQPERHRSIALEPEAGAPGAIADAVATREARPGSAPAALSPATPRASPQAAQSGAALSPTPEGVMPHEASSTASGTGQHEMTSSAEEPTATQMGSVSEQAPSAGQATLLPRPASPKTSSSADPTPPPQSSTNQSSKSAETAALVTRGDGFLRAGDIVSARLFYERAADAGDGSAALRLGATFDPAFLGRVGVRGIAGDAAQAASWYRRARELGESVATDRLKALQDQGSDRAH